MKKLICAASAAALLGLWSVGESHAQSNPDDAAEPSGPAEPTPADEPGHAGHGRDMDGRATPFPVLIAEALGDHPDLDRRRADVAIEQARIEAAGLPPDPTVSLAAEGVLWNDPFDPHPMTGVQLGLTQPLWWPGELDALEDVARLRARAVEPAIDEERIRLIHRAAELYYDVYRIDRTVEALQELRRPILEFRKLLEARIATGNASPAHVERTQLQLLRIEDRILMLHHQRPITVEALNAVLNRPANAPVRPPSEDVDAGLRVETTEPLAPLDELVAQAMERRPFVESIARRIEAARAEARAARYAEYPDLAVFGGWRFRFDNMMDDGTDFIGVGIRSTLPVWSPTRAESAADVAEAQVASLEAQLRAFRLDLRGQISGHLTQLDHLIGHLEFVRDEMRPQALRAREAALAGFATGSARYEDWLEAEKEITEIETRLAELKAKIRQERAMTLALVGVLHAPDADAQGENDE